MALPVYVPEHAQAARSTTATPGALFADLRRRRRGPKGEELLKVEGVSVDFGGLRAVNQVSMTVRTGQIVALIGPNGAGKTTLFNVVSRLQRASGGRVWLGGEDITDLSPADSARLGMARTFQNLRIFENMDVLENVLVGCHRHEKAGFIAGGLGLPQQRREEKASRAARHGRAAPRRPRRRARTCRRPACPTASSAWWRSPARWPPSRACCCSTSPPPA